MAQTTITGCFVGVDTAILTQLQTDALNSIQANLVAGQSASIASRQITRALLEQARWTLLEINWALAGGSVPGISTGSGGGSGTGGSSNPSFPSFSGPITFAG